MKNKGNGLALIPLGVFLLVYLGTSIVAKDFYAVSVIVPFLAAALTALIMNRKIKFDEKVEILSFHPCFLAQQRLKSQLTPAKSGFADLYNKSQIYER